jgi:hypothetical protein
MSHRAACDGVTVQTLASHTKALSRSDKPWPVPQQALVSRHRDSWELSVHFSTTHPQRL